MFPFRILCSHLANIKWMHFYLIPCPFKQLTGFDCPGCGFQRSLIALFRGDLLKSLQLYPATILVVVAVSLSLINLKWPVKWPGLIRSVYLLAAAVIAGAYLVKIGEYLC